jgi:hypothetical protein
VAPTEYAEVEIDLERQDAERFAVEVRFSRPGDDAEVRVKEENLCFGFEELRQLTGDPLAYGRRLGRDVVAFPEMRSVLDFARAQTMDLRFRLTMPPHDKDLQGLRWETLAAPDASEPMPLLTSGRVLFSRYVSSRDWRPVPPRAKGDLRAGRRCQPDGSRPHQAGRDQGGG